MIKGLSLFANVGVAEAYFEEIDVGICLANESIEKRARFYQHLYPNAKMICGDITDDKIRNTIVSESKEMGVNFIIATPPCQGMSVAGNRDPYDERNQLIFYAIDVIKRVQPLFVLLENVPRQLKTKILFGNKRIYIPDYIKGELSTDYTFNEEALIKAKNYGISQLRERNIFLLVRKELGITWRFPPAQKKVVTLEEEIGRLPSLDPMLREGIEFTYEKFPNFETKKAEGAKISKWHKPPKHPWRHAKWMMHTPTGKSAIFNQVNFPKKEDGKRIIAHHNHYRRLSWEKPCRTVTKFNAYISTLCSVHPGRKIINSDGETLYSDPRALSIYELMIVMSLPVDWDIPDSADDSFIRTVIGEGIPPKLTKELMLELTKQLDNKGINI